MNIDRDGVICGLKPAELKQLLRRDYFSTIEAMKLWAMNEPAASRTLRELAAEGWIAFNGVRDHVESWTTAEMGRRLAVTRLIKRFPVAEGKTALVKIVAMARELNLEPASSRRIVSIVLFGSVLTAPEDGDCGDIDLVVSVRRRKLPKDNLETLEAEEEQRAPAGSWPIWNNQRERELLRAIRKISHRIALHSESDIDTLRPAHQEIYRYNISNEREVPAGTFVPAAEPLRENEDRTKPTQPIPRLSPPEWPLAPNSADADHTDLEALLHCQHAWIRGEPLARIAKRTRIPRAVCRNYIASLRDRPDRLPERLQPGFRATMLMAGLPLMGSVSVEKWPGQRLFADVTVYDSDTYERRAWVRRVARYDANFWGQSHLFACLDAVSFAAWQYASRLARTAPLLGFRISTSSIGETVEDEHSGSSAPRLGPFLAPMIALLHEQRRRVGKGRDTYNERIVIDFNSTAPIQHVTRSDHLWPFRGDRVLKCDAPELWRLIAAAKAERALLKTHKEQLLLFVGDRGESD